MENVTFIEFPDANGNMHEHAVIDHGGGHLTTMPKENYDAQQAAQAQAYLNKDTLVTESAPTA